MKPWGHVAVISRGTLDDDVISLYCRLSKIVYLLDALKTFSVSHNAIRDT